MDTDEFFFLIRIISLSRPKPIGPALRVAGPKKTKNDASKIDFIGFKTDTAENFFEKFALFLLVTQNQ